MLCQHQSMTHAQRWFSSMIGQYLLHWFGNGLSPAWHHDSTLTKATVYPKKNAHGFVVLCFVVVMLSFIMNLHEVFIHIHQGCFAGTGAIVRLPQCQWSKPDGYGKISQCITTTQHSKAVTVCIFLGIYCSFVGTGPFWHKFSITYIYMRKLAFKKMHLQM